MGLFCVTAWGELTPASASSLLKGHTSPYPTTTKFNMSCRGSNYIAVANSPRISRTASISSGGPELKSRSVYNSSGLEQATLPLCLSFSLGCANCLITQPCAEVPGEHTTLLLQTEVPGILMVPTGDCFPASFKLWGSGSVED